MPTPAWKKRNVFEDVLRNEDPLTDALRNFLRYSPVQEALCQALPEHVSKKVSFTSVEDIETRPHDFPDEGVPDLVLYGSNFVVLIEVKIAAGPTGDHQENAYVDWINKALQNHEKEMGFIMFLVPDNYLYRDRLDTIIKKAQKQCLSDKSNVQVLNCITWSKVVKSFESQEISSFNELIREFYCHLSERFAPKLIEFTDQEIIVMNSEKTASMILKLMSIIQEIKDKLKPYGIGISQLQAYSYGYNFHFDSYSKKKTVWFGIWPEYWKNHENAPICICIYKNPKHNPPSILNDFRELYGDRVKDFKDGDEDCLVAGFELPGSGEDCGKLIEEIVEDIQCLLRKAKN